MIGKSVVLSVAIALVACAGPSGPADSGNASDAPSAGETAIAPAEPAPPDTEPTETDVAREPASVEELWSRLQQPETHYFVLMRHAIAPGTGDPETFTLGDCSTQRNLSEDGREQARQTGETFRARGVEVRQVLSSQWCRCLETAELMDLGAVEPFPPLNSFFRDRSTRTEQTDAVREFALAQPNEPAVTLMVTHFVNISALTGAGGSSGEMAVMQVADGELVPLGRIPAR